MTVNSKAAESIVVWSICVHIYMYLHKYIYIYILGSCRISIINRRSIGSWVTLAWDPRTYGFGSCTDS